jgi:hypothetical protein
MQSTTRQTQCMFCGLGIEPKGHDPCALVLITHWDQPADKQHEQQFWCHAECLRKLAVDNVPFYVLDLD